MDDDKSSDSKNRTETGGAGSEGARARKLLEDFQVEIDPERIDEAVRNLG